MSDGGDSSGADGGADSSASSDVSETPSLTEGQSEQAEQNDLSQQEIQPPAQVQEVKQGEKAPQQETPVKQGEEPPTEEPTVKEGEEPPESPEIEISTLDNLFWQQENPLTAEVLTSEQNNLFQQQENIQPSETQGIQSGEEAVYTDLPVNEQNILFQQPENFSVAEIPTSEQNNLLQQQQLESEQPSDIEQEEVLNTQKSERAPLNAKYGYTGEVFMFDAEKKAELNAKYPEGVRFTPDGYPDFSPYATHTVQIEMKGNCTTDFTAANNAAKVLDPDFVQPPEYTWHHHQDTITMQLVPRDLHRNVPHSGGVSIVKRQGA